MCLYNVSILIKFCKKKFINERTRKIFLWDAEDLTLLEMCVKVCFNCVVSVCKNLWKSQQLCWRILCEWLTTICYNTPIPLCICYNTPTPLTPPSYAGSKEFYYGNVEVFNEANINIIQGHIFLLYIWWIMCFSSQSIKLKLYIKWCILRQDITFNPI